MNALRTAPLVHSAFSLSRGLAAVVLTLAASASLSAWADVAPMQPSSGASVRDVPMAQRAAAMVSTAWPATSLHVSQEASLVGATQTTGAALSTQTTLWAKRRALAVGVGVDQRGMPEPVSLHASTGSTTPLPQRQTLMVGVALHTGAHTSVSVQTPLWSDGHAESQPKPMNLRSRHAVADLRDSLQLKMQLDPGTSVALRPRKRGVGVTLHSRW